MNKKILIIAFIVVIIDQVTKYFIDSYLNLNQSITIIKNFFNITYIHNSGAAWGIFKNNSVFLVLISLVILVIFITQLNKFKKNIKNILALGLIIGGLIGNLIDRIFFSHVKDFLDFNIFGYDYPIFNIADISVVIGAILLIIAIIRGEDNDSARWKSVTNW